MLRLTLIRHAKTEPAHEGQEDWDRALEGRGQHDAVEMSRRLKERKLKPEKVLLSPAVRTVSTAQIMARELGLSADKLVEDERLYLCSAKDMLRVVNEKGRSASHLAVVGHNPGITDFADRICSERSMDNMPTCAVYTMEVDLTRWADLDWACGVNAEFDYPRKG